MSVSAQDVKEGRLNDELASQLESVSEQLEENVEQGRKTWTDLKANAEERGRAMASAANDYIHERPWEALGIAAGVGLVIGLLCARR